MFKYIVLRILVTVLEEAIDLDDKASCPCISVLIHLYTTIEDNKQVFSYTASMGAVPNNISVTARATKIARSTSGISSPI